MTDNTRIHGLLTEQARNGPPLFFPDPTTRVTFKSLGADEITEYLDKINPLDKAGAYAVQDHGEMIVEKVEGSYSNVVGLPVERLRSELRHFSL